MSDSLPELPPPPEQTIVPADSLTPSDSYSRRRFNQSAADTREKLKQDIGMSTSAGILAAVIQASVSGFSLATILLSVSTFLLTLIVFFLYYYIFSAPTKLDKEKRAEIETLSSRLITDANAYNQERANIIASFREEMDELGCVDITT